MRSLIFTYAVIIMSCQSKVDLAEYKNLLDKSELVQLVETDSFIYTLKFLPAGFMVLKSENVQSANFDDVRIEFSEANHFQLEIEDKYPARLKKPSTSMYYLTDFQHQLTLNQDSLVTYYHHEASNIKGKETFLFGFSKPSNTEVSVTIKKHIMDVNLKFTFPKEEILKFENLNLKI